MMAGSCLDSTGRMSKEVVVPASSLICIAVDEVHKDSQLHYLKLCIIFLVLSWAHSWAFI